MPEETSDADRAESMPCGLYDYGFRAVISSFFADIFKNNALNNGLLPVVIPTDTLEHLFILISKEPSMKVKMTLSISSWKYQKRGWLSGLI